MSKDLEQLRLNMITSMMDLDQDALLKIKDFMANQDKIGWKNHINEKNVHFVDFSKVAKRKTNKPSIVFL